METFETDMIRLSWFSEMAREIAGARTIHEAVDRVMVHVNKVFGPLSCSLLLRDRATGELRFVHVEGPGSDKIRNLKLARGQGVAGWVAEHGEPLLLTNVRDDPRFHMAIDELTGFVTTSIVAVPLTSRSEVFGVIELINKLDESMFSEFESLVLQTVADLAATAIERAYYLRTIQRIALTDPLTGLSNRRAFERILEREIEKTRRNGSLFALLLIDVDHFKSINDRFGHPVGDQVLKVVADILASTARKTDLCARLGGDEFAVLLPETTESHASFVVRRLQLALDSYNQTAEISLSLSVGAQIVDPKAPDAIMEGADRAMYRAKGRPVSDFESGLEESLKDWLETSKD